MRLPRDLSARDLIITLKRLGYEVDHQTGSHIRLTTQQEGEHHITIPAHDPIRIGTLNSILRDVAEYSGMTREQLLERLFG
ncbi:MAG: type II toxin-antitoxin system HicA family toxin [Phycisphaerae bacterium]|nr:type II toxin-antitoxin system HicA family toxin [Phycisphaerae bacterium]